MTIHPKVLTIVKPYGPRTFALYAGRNMIGTATESNLEPGRWLCDVRRPKTLDFFTLPAHAGSLLSALRYVKENRLM